MSNETLVQKPAETEGGDSPNRPRQHWKTKGRHTYTDNTHRGVQKVEGQKIVETMPIPTKFKKSQIRS